MKKNKNILLLIGMVINVISYTYAQVGINTQDVTEDTALKIEGDWIVRHPNQDISDFLYLYRHNGILKQSAASLNDKPFYKIRFKLDCAHMTDNAGVYYWGIKVQKFDTRIPSASYRVFLLSSIIRYKETNKPALISNNIPWTGKAKEQYANSVKRSYVLVHKGQTWSIIADYPGAHILKNTLAETKGGFYWDFEVLVVKVDQKLPIVSADDHKIFVADASHVPKIDDTFRGKILANAQKISFNETVKFLPKGTYSPTNLVGINTDDPQAELDVNGKVLLRDAPVGDNRLLFPLGVSSGTNKLGSLSESNRPFCFLNGKIYIKNSVAGSEDYIQNFDTKIPYEEYTLFNSFTTLGNDFYDGVKRSGGKVVIGTAHYVYKPKRGNLEIGNGQENISLWKDPATKTWHFTADYADVKPVCGRVIGNDIVDISNDYYWKYSWLAISNTFIEDLGEVEIPRLVVPRGDNYSVEIMGKKENNNDNLEEIHDLIEALLSKKYKKYGYGSRKLK